jgi:hypothetical protein
MDFVRERDQNQQARPSLQAPPYVARPQPVLVERRSRTDEVQPGTAHT